MIEAVMAGALLGMMMASIFIAAGAVAALPYVHPDSPGMAALAGSEGNYRRVLLLALGIYPLWAALGAIAGLGLAAFESGVPGSGLGSPNMAFTALLVGIATIATIPAAIRLRRSAWSVAVIGLAFAGLFGWALPYFAR